MMKSKLLKALALGLCLSALYTGAALASETGGGTTPAYQGQADPKMDALLDKQTEIDRYLFADHIKDIEAKGFKAAYTGIVDSYVEIGITPYTDENAQYLYDIFGKENVKVVEGNMAVAYADAGVATDAVTSGATDAPAANEAVPLKGAPDEAVSSTGVAAPTDDQLYSIQIESVEDTAADAAASDNAAVSAPADSSEVYETVSAPVDQASADIRTVSAAENNVVSTAVEKANNMPVAVIILIIACAAALVGGTVLLTLRKKSLK